MPRNLANSTGSVMLGGSAAGSVVANDPYTGELDYGGCIGFNCFDNPNASFNASYVWGIGANVGLNRACPVNAHTPQM